MIEATTERREEEGRGGEGEREERRTCTEGWLTLLRGRRREDGREVKKRN